MSTKGVYRFFEDYGRMGCLCGVFIDTDDRVAKVIASGKEIYFDDVLGKHSEVSIVLSDENTKLVSAEEDFVAIAEQGGLAVGIDPVAAFYEEHE